MKGAQIRRSAMAAVLIGTIAAGCMKATSVNEPNRAGQQAAPAGPVNQQPVKIRLLDTSRMSADTFKSAMTDPLLKRQPTISVEPVVYPEGAEWKKLLASESPDLVLVPLSELESAQGMNDWLELSELIKEMTNKARKLDQLPKNASDPFNGAEKLIGPSGTYGLLPPGAGASLYYNKDIFDKFAVPYPREGLTWSETKELTIRLTRVDGGGRYQGFAADRSFLLNNMSKLAPLVDPQTDRFVTEGWQRWLNTLKAVYEAPGMEKEQAGRDYGKNRFMKKGDLAMWAGNFIYPVVPEQQLRSGRIKLPSFDNEMNSRTGLPDGYYFAIPKTAKHPQEALHVVASIARTQIFSKLESVAVGELGKQFDDVLAGHKDLNTAFREAEEVVEIRLKAGQVN